MSIVIPEAVRSRFLERFYLQSNANRPPLRIGVFIDSPHLIAPFAVVLDQIRRSNFAKLELVVENVLAAPAAGPPPPRGIPAKVWNLLADPARRSKLAYTLYTRWDQKRHPLESEILSLVDCSALFENVESIAVEPLVKGFVHRFPEEAVQLVSSRSLDVILRFGFNIIRGDMLRAARYGIWSYHHGDNDFYRGGPSHFWELYENNPCSGVILQVLNEELDNGLILDKSIATTTGGISHAANRVRPYLLGTHMVIRALHRLHEQGWESLKASAFSSKSYQGRRKIYRLPVNSEISRFLVGRASSSIRRRLRDRGRKFHWRLACRRLADPAQLPSNLDGFDWVESPRDRFWADPFLVDHDGRTFAFFEDYSYLQQRGCISCAELSPNGRLSDAVPILEEPCHLSYPFLFERDGAVFMIPESQGNGIIALYRATDFPYRWKQEKVLLDMAGLDTTIHEQDGTLYLFTNVFDPPGADYSLVLFHATDLFGEWGFHPSNPISADVRKARNAGRIFRCGDKLIRPAQDCSVRYGYSLSFQAITTLNPCDYAEKTVGSILPPEHQGIYGVHTYARGGGFEVVDGTVLRRV